MLCGFLSSCAWTIVISPVVVLIAWGCWLIVILGRDIIGLAVVMAGVALLLAFYAVMLWWITQWQSSIWLCRFRCRIVAFLFEGVVLVVCMALFVGSLLALGGIISAKPLEDLSYKGLTGDQRSVSSPYASSVYLGWAAASAIALIVTGVLPIVSWFATYRFSLSSAACIGLFAAVLVSFCGASYIKVVDSRGDQVPTKADFLAALLPLICIPAILSLSTGLLKWKDDNWKLSRGAYVFVIIGLLLLLGAISAVTVIKVLF